MASDFRPDKDALDEEWVKQPELFHQYAVEHADATLELEELKDTIEVIKAELDKDIRAHPKRYGFQKITDAVVKAAIPEQEEYKKAVRRVNKAKHKVDVLAAGVKALDHKKKALENLVYLHGQNYFSSPRGDGNNSKEIEESVRKKKGKKRNPNITRRQLREEEDDE